MPSHPGSCGKEWVNTLYARHAKISKDNPLLGGRGGEVQDGVYKMCKREGVYVLFKYA